MWKKHYPRKSQSTQKLILQKLISAKISFHVRNWKTKSINENFDLAIESGRLKTIMANYDLKELLFCIIRTSQLSRIPFTDHMFHRAWDVSSVSYMFHRVSQSLHGNILLSGNPFYKWLKLEQVDLKAIEM